MKLQSINRLILLFSLQAILFTSCKEDSKMNDEQSSSSSVENSAKEKEKKDSLIPIKPKLVLQDGFYNALVIPKDKKAKDSLFALLSEKYTEKERYAILALNRLDSKHKRSTDTLVIPAKIDTTLISYSPFPLQLEILAPVKKMVFFSYPIQAYGVYSNGNLVKWGPTSMGKKASQTKRGLTFANWKKELSISSVSTEWKLPYNFNIFNTLGIGWHQYDLPGYPASHSCLRLLMDDAKWLFKYADTWVLNSGGATTKAKGTPVMVFGDYKWGGRKPWRKLLENPKANDISVEEMNALIQPNIEKILAEQTNREKVIDSINLAKANAAANLEEVSKNTSNRVFR